MGVFKAQNLANTTWAFAMSGRSDAILFCMLASAAEHIGGFAAQEFANTVWAFTMAGEPVPALLDPLSVLDMMNVQGHWDDECWHPEAARFQGLRGPALASMVGSKPHPATLTVQIKEAGTIEAVLRMHRVHESGLD